MLKEIPNIRQNPGEPLRRWFSGLGVDLLVWYEHRDVIGFQLCYRSGPEEHALTWFADRGLSHSRVDDGESVPGRYKMAPLLVRNGLVDTQRVLRLFQRESSRLSVDIVAIVTGALTYR